jgi:hypothetical protein
LSFGIVLAGIALVLTRGRRIPLEWQAAAWLVVIAKFALPWAMPFSLADGGPADHAITIFAWMTSHTGVNEAFWNARSDACSSAAISAHERYASVAQLLRQGASPGRRRRQGCGEGDHKRPGRAARSLGVAEQFLSFGIGGSADHAIDVRHLRVDDIAHRRERGLLERAQRRLVVGGDQRPRAIRVGRAAPSPGSITGATAAAGVR